MKVLQPEVGIFGEHESFQSRHDLTVKRYLFFEKSMFCDELFEPFGNDFEEPLVRNNAVSFTIDFGSSLDFYMYFANVAEDAVGIGLNLHIKMHHLDVLHTVYVVHEADEVEQ